MMQQENAERQRGSGRRRGIVADKAPAVIGNSRGQSSLVSHEWKLRDRTCSL
jgi:hypothetical protein